MKGRYVSIAGRDEVVLDATERKNVRIAEPDTEGWVLISMAGSTDQVWFKPNDGPGFVAAEGGLFQSGPLQDQQSREP